MEKINIFKSNPKDIRLIKTITKDSYCSNWIDNIFAVFKSINNILYLIYTSEENDIISYNLLVKKKILKIKKAHNL